jgi:hypothetical protein
MVIRRGADQRPKHFVMSLRSCGVTTERTARLERLETGWMHSGPSYFAELMIGETSWASIR